MALTDEQWANLHEESKERKRFESGSSRLEETKASLKPFVDEAERARAEFLEVKATAEDLLAKMESLRPFSSMSALLNRQLEGVYGAVKVGARLTGNFDEVGRYVGTLSQVIIRDTPGSPAAVAEAKVKTCWQQIGKLRGDISEAHALLDQYKVRPRYGVPPPSPFEAQAGSRPNPEAPEYSGKVLTNVEGNERGINKK